ncbi:hypothetical protein NKH18_25720 [Streptomyces sp. M10(2022)]
MVAHSVSVIALQAESATYTTPACPRRRTTASSRSRPRPGPR